jgi:hypothetical protein
VWLFLDRIYPLGFADRLVYAALPSDRRAAARYCFGLTWIVT